MSTRRAILILVLALIAALTWWLQREPDQRLRLLPTAGPQGPDFYMRDFQIRVTGEAGHLQYQLAGEQAAHMQDDGHGELLAPVMHFHQDRLPPVRVQAETGWISPPGDEIRLLGAVTIERPAEHPDGPLHMTTRDLHVFPELRQAQTDARVVARAPAYTVEGVGMRMNMNERTVILESQVNGTYAP